MSYFIVNKVSFSGLTENSSVSKGNTDIHFTIHGISRLKIYSKIIKKWKITNLSYEHLLKGNKKTLIYLDPPYELEKKKYKKKRSLHIYGLKGSVVKNFDHNSFADNVNKSKAYCLISYNDSQIIKNRFKQSRWNKVVYDHRYSLRSVGTYHEDQKKRQELLLKNY